MEYFLKANALIILFYAFYKVFLEKETFFIHNRWFLIGGLLAAFSIPLVVIPVYVTQTTNTFTHFVEVGITSETTTNPFTFTQLLPYFYVAGLAFFGIKLCIELVSLIKILQTKPKTISNGFRIIETDKATAPFSFFNWIVYAKNNFDTNELKQIIIHEKVHVRQKHTLDHLLAQFACVVCWFNPIVWLYKKTLLQNLEFIADHETQQTLNNTKSYQHLLLKTSLNTSQLAFATHFYTSIIKKRIIMLHKTKSNTKKQWLFFAIIPVLAIFMMSFNTKTVLTKTTASTTKSVPMIITKDTKDASLNLLVQTLSDKGVAAKFKNVKRNKKGEIVGINISLKSENASTSYSVKSDKPIAPISIQISDNAKHIAITSGDSKIKELTVMANNTNGAKNTTYVITETNNDNNVILIKSTKDGEPVSSEIIEIEEINETNGDGHKVIAINKSKTISVISTDKDKAPLYILEGKEITQEEMSNIKSHLIEKISVLKGEKAIKKYGEKGKNGVIEIMLKK